MPRQLRTEVETDIRAMRRRRQERLEMERKQIDNLRKSLEDRGLSEEQIVADVAEVRSSLALRNTPFAREKQDEYLALLKSFRAQKFENPEEMARTAMKVR